MGECFRDFSGPGEAIDTVTNMASGSSRIAAAAHDRLRVEGFVPLAWPRRLVCDDRGLVGVLALGLAELRSAERVVTRRPDRGISRSCT